MPDPVVTQSPFLPPPAPQAQPPQPTLGALAQPSPIQQGPPPQTQADLAQKASGWDSFFANPAVATALFQFGINLLQPRPVGQSEIGAIGQSVGAAGEAVGRVQKLKFEQEQEAAKGAREEQRVGFEGRRTAADERRAQTDEARAAEEAKYHDRWLDIQKMQVQISAMHAGIAGAANSLARERLTQEADLANKRLDLERDKLAQDWIIKHVDRSDKKDSDLLSKMYDATMRQPRLPDEAPPDINKIGQDFLTLRTTLKNVKEGGADVFTLGTESQWRQMLGNPTLKQQAIDTFGADVVTRAEKKIKDIDTGAGAPAAPVTPGGPR